MFGHRHGQRKSILLTSNEPKKILRFMTEQIKLIIFAFFSLHFGVSGRSTDWLIVRTSICCFADARQPQGYSSQSTKTEKEKLECTRRIAFAYKYTNRWIEKPLERFIVFFFYFLYASLKCNLSLRNRPRRGLFFGNSRMRFSYFCNWIRMKTLNGGAWRPDDAIASSN